MKYKIQDIAKWFIGKEVMSLGKLQCLCYYSYSWYLAEKDERLFDEKFEAWVHVPTSVELRSSVDDFFDVKSVEGSVKTLDVNTISFLQEVWDAYGELSKYELEGMISQEHPYRQTRKGLDVFEICNETLSDDDMILEYRYRNLKEFILQGGDIDSLVYEMVSYFSNEELIGMVEVINKGIK